MKHKRKRSEVSYEKVILELLYYYCWDAKVDERVNKRYQRLWKIKNPGVGKPYGRSIADIAIKKMNKFLIYNIGYDPKRNRLPMFNITQILLVRRTSKGMGYIF